MLPIQGDRVQSQQVLLNLLLNAVEAMSLVEAGPRELLISTEQTQADGIAVGDFGPGIDPGHFDRVFRGLLHHEVCRLGMGLAICRTIIEARGGRLSADVNEPSRRGIAILLARCGRRLKLPNLQTEYDAWEDVTLSTDIEDGSAANDPNSSA